MFFVLIQRNFLSVQADWEGKTFVYQFYDMFRFNGGRVVVIVIRMCADDILEIVLENL